MRSGVPRPPAKSSAPTSTTGTMGNKNSKKKEELQQFLTTTHFDQDQIRSIYERFSKISSSREDDGVIDKNEFREALGLKDTLYADRLFALFDEDGNGSIDFREFICGLSVCSTQGTAEEKMLYSFRIWDFDNDGYITKDELKKLLHASLMERSVDISEAQLNNLVEGTFLEGDVNKDHNISFEEYKALVAKHPAILSMVSFQAPVTQP
eukprot:ANDGO_05858.mRNA.1 Calcineurin B-like protein 2